ncbi:MAG: hypothetical protein EPN39_18760 [Chitinophagaceae bacterium]|nr:MAG: hypothetical protein EPN39_18760 [Chitinophagaceae bacterium]
MQAQQFGGVAAIALRDEITNDYPLLYKRSLMGIERQDSDFKVILLYEMKSRKRWPEKSARRA